MWESINSILVVFNTVTAPIALVLSILSFLKIRSVNENLNKQKNVIRFNKNRSGLLKELDNLITVVGKDGDEQDISAILPFCNKIEGYYDGFDSANRKKLSKYISNITKICRDNNINSVQLSIELKYLKNLLEKIGEINGI